MSNRGEAGGRLTATVPGFPRESEAGRRLLQERLALSGKTIAILSLCFFLIVSVLGALSPTGHGWVRFG